MILIIARQATRVKSGSGSGEWSGDRAWTRDRDRSGHNAMGGYRERVESGPGAGRGLDITLWVVTGKEWGVGCPLSLRAVAK
jgi:hypothetical protein